MRAWTAVAVVSMWGCATVGTPRDDGPSPIVAKYGDKVIRLSEVDAKAGDELLKLQEQIYDLRAEAAEQLAVEALVSKKALAAGQSDDDWLGKNVEEGLTEPTDEQMHSLFEKVHARLPPQVGYDDVKVQLKQVLQKEARTKKAREVFAAITKEAGFTLLLEGPPKVRKTVDTTGPSRGSKGAKVVIVEFADFECPYCARAHETVQAILKSYGDKVRLVFRHYPLSNHLKAPKAAEAAVCADEQGKFWELHDSLFDSQELDETSLSMQALRLGLDDQKFQSCMESGRGAGVVKRDMAVGNQLGVSGTPAFFINGLMLSGAQPEKAFRKLIDGELSRLGQ